MSDFREYSAAFYDVNNDIFHYGTKGMKWHHHKRNPISISNNPLNSYFVRSNYEYFSDFGRKTPKDVIDNEKYIKSKNFKKIDDRSLEVQYKVVEDEQNKEFKKKPEKRDIKYMDKLFNDKEAIKREMRRRKRK